MGHEIGVDMKMTVDMMPAGYQVEIDNVDKNLWSELLTKFNDASIYQTWSYGAVLYGEKNLSHFILKKDSDVIAIAQVGIRKIPALLTGIANIHWGPLWRKKDIEENSDNFFYTINTLKNEYVVKRQLLLRIWPNEIEIAENIARTLLEDSGFIYNLTVPKYRTFRLSLTPSLEELRQNLDRKWRQALARAERFAALDIEYGTSEEHYRIALNIYNEMHVRKQFSKFDMEGQGFVQKDLPESLKMKILICRLKGEPIAALGWSTIGNTGLPLIAATGDKAVSLSTNASNLLWWKMIEDMKEQGCIFCDVGGIDPKLNPGGYKFKSGLLGQNEREEKHIGQFLMYNNLRAYLIKIIIDKTRLIRKRLSALRK